MATKTVFIEVTAVPQEFPLGTVAEDFLFELIYASDGAPASKVAQPGLVAIFPLVLTGLEMIARVTRNGVTVEQRFTVPKDNETIDVPSSFTIRFE